MAGPYGVTYRIPCDCCDAVHEESHIVYPLTAAPLPCLPRGWRVVGMRNICDKHEIVLTVDEKILPAVF